LLVIREAIVQNSLQSL